MYRPLGDSPLARNLLECEEVMLRAKASGSKYAKDRQRCFRVKRMPARARTYTHTHQIINASKPPLVDDLSKFGAAVCRDVGTALTAALTSSLVAGKIIPLVYNQGACACACVVCMCVCVCMCTPSPLTIEVTACMKLLWALVVPLQRPSILDHCWVSPSVRCYFLLALAPRHHPPHLRDSSSMVNGRRRAQIKPKTRPTCRH